MEFLFAGCSEALLANKTIYLSLFLGGLFGSVHHCAGMCGPFIIAQTTQNSHSSETILMRASGNALLPYHIGRMMTYVILGVLASAIIYPVMHTLWAQLMITILLAGAGILFLLHGLSIYMHINHPFKDILSKISSGFAFNTSPLHKFALGATLGFMPCGLVLAAILAVTSLSSPFYAMIGMIVFTLGTLPMLMSIGFISKLFMNKFKQLYTTFTKAIMIFNGLSLILLSMDTIL